MTSNEDFARYLYGELQKVMTAESDVRDKYQVMSRVYTLTLNQATTFNGLRLAGLFAKTDYILKTNHTPLALQRAINDARIRLKHFSQTPHPELEECCPYDLNAVCQLIELTFKTRPPLTLSILFPQKLRTVRKDKIVAQQLRMVVNRWDEDFVYGSIDETETEEQQLALKSSEPIANDWSYLTTFLSKGSQLNLIQPRQKDGILHAELIIYEPDYLTDISLIASCFEDYGPQPLIALLNKLRPNINTSATLLGNLASQMLDEELFMKPAENTYQQSAKRFFRDQAINLLTAGIDLSFHQQAQVQKKNIRKTVKTTLPHYVPDFKAEKVMVEPSFFSEMLGLQGRMDFLQLDHRVLIEQKSGKGGFPPHDADTPIYQTKHYVQMLLYMLLLRYNYREQYEHNRHELKAFLLYSKYKNGLLGLGFAPELVFQAIKVRNEIVANEYRFSRGGFEILTTLRADHMNINQRKGVLWEKYQRPEIERLLQPITDASPLERAYYLRMLTFVSTEHLMSKTGCGNKENSGFADKWQSTTAEKLQAGNIYLNLQLMWPTADVSEKVGRLELQFDEGQDHDISNFRKGDIVVLYPYKEGEEPDVRRTMVFRCTIEDITTEQLTLSLRSTQVSPMVFWYKGACRWAVEHDFFESSFGSLYRGLHAFLSAPKERRDMLLLQRTPGYDEQIRLKGDYGSFNPLALKVKQAKELFLIIGPPGTGKTSFGLMTTLHEELLNKDSSVLLLSYTNRAVDEICSKLVESGIDFIRIGSRYSCEKAYKPYLLEEQVHDCKNLDDLRSIVCSKRVFVGTTTSMNSNVSIFRLKSFNLAIIDEASQILEPHLMGLLSAKDETEQAAIKKIVLIGDHKQLPAVVQQPVEDSAVNDPILNDIGLMDCRLSLFERLLTHYRNDEHVVFMLTRQGRMHHDIAAFPNRYFYQNRLQEVPFTNQLFQLPRKGRGINGIEDMLTTSRLSFVSVEPPLNTLSFKSNENEAEAIAATVEMIFKLNKEEKTIGIVVPYRNQIASVRSHIEQRGIGTDTITIDTVERFQGSQRDYILYGFTVQRLEQLRFLCDSMFEEEGYLIDRKLNVAMTRAKEHLIIFGNPDLLGYVDIFRQLIDYTREHHSFIDTKLSDYVEGNFSFPC